jgi:hypothetical protein
MENKITIKTIEDLGIEKGIQCSLLYYHITDL